LKASTSSSKKKKEKEKESTNRTLFQWLGNYLKIVLSCSFSKTFFKRKLLVLMQDRINDFHINFNWYA
jgi:hypothetical protein